VADYKVNEILHKTNEKIHFSLRLFLKQNKMKAMNLFVTATLQIGHFC